MGEMWLEGSAGVLRLDGEARLWWKPHHGDEARARLRPRPGDLRRWLLRARCSGTWSRICCTVAPVENTARDYLVNLRVQEAAYESHATGRRIALSGYDPPATIDNLSTRESMRPRTAVHTSQEAS